TGKWRLDTMSGWFTFGLHSVGKGGLSAITFSDNRFTFEHDNPKNTVTGVFSADSTKRPKQITFKLDDRRTVVAIYDFSWGTLRICVGEQDSFPPTEFHGGPRSRPALLIFERWLDE